MVIQPVRLVRAGAEDERLDPQRLSDQLIDRRAGRRRVGDAATVGGQDAGQAVDDPFMRRPDPLRVLEPLVDVDVLLVGLKRPQDADVRLIEGLYRLEVVHLLVDVMGQGADVVRHVF